MVSRPEQEYEYEYEHQTGRTRTLAGGAYSFGRRSRGTPGGGVERPVRML
jgi:hypothetical protein